MEQWEARNWRKRLELNVIKPILIAVQSVAPEIESVEYDLQNDAVIIHSNGTLTGDRWKRVQEISKEKMRSIAPCTSPIRIRQPLRHQYAYTFHSYTEASSKKINKSEEITEFRLDLSALDSLSEAYAELIKRTKDFDLVAGFALGGVPALNFVTVSEFEATKKYRDPSELLNAMREKYHAFPGLQWEIDAGSPQLILKVWMDSLNGRKSVLFFDTGTDGNGVRETADLLQAYIQDCEHSPFSRITVLGIVDGTCEAQRPVHLILYDRSGAPVPFDVSYHRVQNVLTEDCKVLSGYESLRPAGIIQPYSAFTVVHILDKGQTITTVAAHSSGALMSHLIIRKLEVLRQGKMEDTALHNESSGAFLLDLLYQREAGELRKAVELGVLPISIFRPAIRFLRRTYRTKIRERAKDAQSGEAS